jgi:hypothetical protein
MATVIRERRVGQTGLNEASVKDAGSDLTPKKKVAQQEALAQNAIDVSSIVLPTSRTIASQNLIDYALLIFGEEKIGKTSFANQFGQCFFFAFERGAKASSVFTTDILMHWEQVQQYIDLLEDAPKKLYNYFCVDTGHAAYDRCLEYVCRRDNISHPGKVKDYGASWKEVMKEFQKFHSRLARLGGFIVVSHERTREREDREGVKYDRIEPAFSESTEMFYKAICDLVGYYHQGPDGQRYLLIQPTTLIHAGHRMDGHFLTPDGQTIYRIPMGHSALDAYKNFEKAFHNRQTETYEVVATKGGTTKKKVS